MPVKKTGKKVGRPKSKPEEKPKHRYLRARVVWLRESQVICRSPAELSDKVGVTVQTITTWEADEIIPAPTMVDELGRRWYSDKYIAFLVKVVKKHRSKCSTLAEFGAVVMEKYHEQFK